MLILKTFLVCVVSCFLFLISPQKSSAATLFSQAANQDVYEGQTFVVDWYLDTESESVNVLDLGLNFSTSTLEAVETTAGNSLLNLWIKNPQADNQNGTIKLTGGLTNGIQNSKVPIFRTVFKAKAAGPAFINLDSNSRVLLNDGRGTDSLLKFQNLTFNVYPQNFIPLKINSSTHPDSNVWYKNRDVKISFETKPSVSYSYSFSSNAEIIPDNQLMNVSQEFSYPNRSDGIYYFKVNSKEGSNNWQEAGVFRVQIDATVPEEFTPIIGNELDQKFLSFSTLDKMSGISHYYTKVGLFGRTKETQSPLKLKRPLVGDEIVVTAFDIAGNSRQAIVEFPGYNSVGVFEIILIVFGLVVIVFAFLWRPYAILRQKKDENKI